MGVMAWKIGATAAFLCAFAALTLHWMSNCGLALLAPFSDPMPGWQGRPATGRELVWVFVVALLFRLMVADVSFTLWCKVTGESLLRGDIPALWCRWDAPHYVKLVELGYGGYIEDGQPLFLVFFPLYVWLVRGVKLLVGDTALAGMAVSWLCFGWGSTYLYRLGCEEYGPATTRRALCLLWCFPFSFFFGGIMTESLFLLTTAAALYHIRTHHWVRAGVWGVLAALTRMQGIILIGAAVAEWCQNRRSFAWNEKNWKGEILAILKTLPLLCLPILGSLVYFGLNYEVAGDPFAFTLMQRHWSQGFLWFPQVLAYLVKHALTWPNITTRWEMWIPELLLFPLFALILWRGWKKHRSMLTLYGFVYFILTYCLSWLLSAGRYLSCALPCFFFLAEDLKDRSRATVALGAGMFLLQLVFLLRYFGWGQVM